MPPLSNPNTSDALTRYMHLTRVALPQRAQMARVNWPVVNDHCFQRIILDAITGGVWYDHINKPAYRHMTPEQAEQAATLAQDLLDGRADIHVLNAQSKRWRALAKSRARDRFGSCPAEPLQTTLDL